MKNSPFTAVFDACVLYPAPLRDFLMWLALSGRFRARWSDLIHDEWVRNLLKNLSLACRKHLCRQVCRHVVAVAQSNVADLAPVAVDLVALAHRAAVRERFHANARDAPVGLATH